MPDSAAKKKWKTENTKNLVININKNTDKVIFDYLDYLKKVDKPYGAIFKEAIKQYIAVDKTED